MNQKIKNKCKEHEYVFFNHAGFNEYDTYIQKLAFKHKMICKKCSNIKGTDEYCIQANPFESWLAFKKAWGTSWDQYIRR